MKIKAGMEDKYAEYKEKNTKDPYSAEVVRFGEAWADLMEAEIGDKTAFNDVEYVIKTCADDACSKADTSGITGFMYGCAVNALSHFWEHGENLRRWHNLNTQIGNEGEKANENGGTLNPALLNIGTKGDS